jgi:glucose/arabinose dehydrogenase
MNRPLPRMRRVRRAAAVAATLALAACAGPGLVPEAARTGPSPQLPEPSRALVPTLHIAPAVGWAAGQAPQAAPGLRVQPYASGLEHPRWLLVLPNGDVLVAETNAPPKPDDGKGIKGAVMKSAMKKAGAGVPSADRITLLRDADGDGVAEHKSVFVDGLHSPFGMALVGETLYVANSDAVVRLRYRAGALKAEGAAELVTPLPAGTLNHHWTKNIVASADGTKLYATVGSNSNVAEHGMALEQGRAAIWQIDLPSGTKRLYAEGLRNPNGLAWQPETGALWTVVNERDELGNDLVPDYLTSVKDGGFYGWPYSYWGAHVDARVQPPRPELVAKALAPDYALGAHVAALGLAWSGPLRWPAPFGAGMFIGEHGSWNRQPLAGYKVVFVPFQGGRPNGAPVDVLTGFVDADGNARGRPVGVAVDARGGLLVADDVGNAVWRVSAAR